MYAFDSGTPIRSGTVPLPPSSPLSRRGRHHQSTSSTSLPLPGRRISLGCTTQDPFSSNQSRQLSDKSRVEASFDSRGETSSSTTTPTGKDHLRERRSSRQFPPERTRRGSKEEESRNKGESGPDQLERSLAAIDWAQIDESDPHLEDPPIRRSLSRKRDSITAYTVSTVSSRSSYSARPSNPSFLPTHSRGISSSTSLPSSSHLHSPLPTAGSTEQSRQTVKLRPRSSSLSYSRARTPSNGSTASSASSDFPVTPALPRPESQRRRSTVEKGLSRDSPGNWSTGYPVLGGGGGRGPTMVDPRFTFPRSRQAMGGSHRHLNQNSLAIGPFGEQRRTSEEKASQKEQTSFIASLGSKPFLDSTGQELPLFSTAPPAQTSYLPTSPLEPAFAIPPSPFSPTSPVAAISATPPRPSISTFLPHFASSSPTKTTRQSPKRRTTSFSKRVRRRSSPRKPASIRRTSSGSASPRRRQSLRSSSLRHSSPARTRNQLRHRSRSVPDLRSHARSQSVPTPIPFDTFSPRSPYAHETGSKRRPSIADELLLGDTSHRTTPSALGEISNEPIVFPSRKSSRDLKGKGKEGEPARRNPTVPSRTNQPRTSAVAVVKPRKTSMSSRPTAVKGSYILPHPRLIVSDAGEAASSSQEEDESEAIKRRYREGSASDGQGRDSRRRRSIDADEESIDHSSILRVLRENEESRKEREAWSDSATKTLGLGLGLKLAEFERKKKSARGPGNVAFGGGRNREKEERRKVRKEVEQEKRRAADSGTDGEGGTVTRRTRRQPTAADASPPIPQSFDPFVQLGRKLSLSRSKSRDHRIGGGGESVSPVSTKKASEIEPPSSPRTVRGKPIRHLRTSPSVDSIFTRPEPSRPVPVRDDSATQYGEAVSFDENVPLNAEHRRPSLTNQNAFLSLPPHLHHLLRSPERTSYEPSRAPPPIPSSLYSLSHDSNRLSTSSVASAARLSLALETQLSRVVHGSLGPGAPTLARTNARTPEVTESRLSRSTSTPGLLCDSSDRYSLDNSTPVKHAITAVPQSHSLSPLPEIESPDSQRSVNSHSHSDASSGLEVDSGNNWQSLFFSPPRRTATSLQQQADPSISIMVASDDDTGTDDTDETFNIRRLQRTRKSLEALFNLANNSETAQETLLLPSNGAPSFSRSTSHLSSAQASFVTARETAAENDGAFEPQHDTTRPLPTPAQTPWSSTSFAREYLDDIQEGGGGRVQAKRASSRASGNSYIDFGADDDVLDPVRLQKESNDSPLSFLDDFSPPSSAPPSPTIPSAPLDDTFSNPSRAPIVPPAEPESLPTSPTLSSTFEEEDNSNHRFSRVPTNRDSHLSVNSHNFHISPTAAKFASHGGSTRSHSYNSSRSNMLSSFPVPPVDEEETGSDGDDEREAAETEERGRGSTLPEENDEATLRFDPPSPHSSRRLASLDVLDTTSASSSPTVSATDSPSVPGRSETSNSFLDVSDASDSDSRRWSRGTFQTFYYGTKRQESVPPLPSPSRD